MVERLVLVDAAGLRPEDPALSERVTTLLPQDVAGLRRMVATVRHEAPPIPDFVARDILERRRKDEWFIRRALESMGKGEDWLIFKEGRVTWKDHFCCSRDLAAHGKTLVVPAGGRVVFLEDAGDRPRLRSVGLIPNMNGSE